ncbi:elongation factor 1-alpha [Novosphingobium sp. PY1]|nr:elongation factor 1-alpha [Novosphingobium sp. PY1]
MPECRPAFGQCAADDLAQTAVGVDEAVRADGYGQMMLAGTGPQQQDVTGQAGPACRSKRELPCDAVKAGYPARSQGVAVGKRAPLTARCRSDCEDADAIQAVARIAPMQFPVRADQFQSGTRQFIAGHCMGEG